MNDPFPKVMLVGIFVSMTALAVLNREFFMEYVPQVLAGGLFFVFMIGFAMWHFSQLPDSNKGRAVISPELQEDYNQHYQPTAPMKLTKSFEKGGDWIVNFGGSDEEVDIIISEIEEEDSNKKKDQFGFVEKTDTPFDLDWEIGESELSRKVERQLQKVNNT